MSQTFQVISPVDGSVYLERRIATVKEIDDCLTNAVKAQAGWKSTSISERTRICEKVVTYFVRHAREIGNELTWQMGRPIRYTPYELTKGFKERATYMIEKARDVLEDTPMPKQVGFKRFIRREPLGTVLVLAPWNYPYLTSVNVIIPAIMAGNSVILKHAKQTPLCAERYADAFQFAGLPEYVFNFLHLDHEQVTNVIKDKRINYVAFTGSVAGGYAISKALGNRLINAGLELGGKDPAYVREDADLNSTIENLVDGSFFNSGQSCCGIERIYVHESQYQKFVDGFVSLTKKYKLGIPTNPRVTLGPMVKTAAAKMAQKQIKKAIASGAKSLIDPFSFANYNPDSPYMAPQVLTNVDHSMEIMSEETFAPVVGIMSVKNDQEAIELMNDSQYGLTASIWTSDMQKAMEIGNQIDTGTVYMNRCDYLDPALAWTGVKNSGRGCTLSTLGYDALTRSKSFHLRK